MDQLTAAFGGRCEKKIYLRGIRLPFTPFHMGAGLIVKPSLNRHFSLITFGMAQVAMDIEPGIRIILGADVLHGPTHTILGALVIACLMMLVAPSVCSYLQERWNKEVLHYRLLWLVQSEAVPKVSVAIGALFGSISHVALDCLIHSDIQPLQPFSRANPLLGLITHDQVYDLCALAGIFGAGTWIILKLFGRPMEFKGMPVPSVVTILEGFRTVWFRELKFTWLWTFLLSFGLALLFGSGLSSLGILLLTALIGIPGFAIRRFVTKSFQAKELRQLVVMLLVPILAMSFVAHLDEKIPEKAHPITKALESYRSETGHYPESLEMLMPKHLAKIPYLKFSLIQPQVNYRIKDGRPYLTIPSARGDGFAEYEYDFATKEWRHFS